MTIELNINGKTVRLWNLDYNFGPSPLEKSVMYIKELELEKKVLECKCDAAVMICENPYEMFVVVRSALRPEKINPDEYADFLIMVAKNKNRKVIKAE